MGLASQTDINVNWCPALGTVLANEEVIDGLSERGSHPVKKLPLRQWVLHIPQYADELEKDLESVDWPEGTISAQKQWIGRSVGASINFTVCDSTLPPIEVFTTRADTIFGVTYLVLAPEHDIVQAFVKRQHVHNRQKAFEIENYVKNSVVASDIDRLSQSKDKKKTGVFTGEYATHPLTQERIPIWIADYVLGSYGTGAIMSVPAHDSRDYEFASAFNLPMRRVIKASVSDDEKDVFDLPFVGEGYSCNCPEDHKFGNLNGLSSSSCAEEVAKLLQSGGSKGVVTTFKLRDWGFSRQRYWGEPIPIYFPVEIVNETKISDCADSEQIIINKVDSDGDMFSSSDDPRYGAPHIIRYDLPISVAEEDLPLNLPPMDDFSPSNDPQGCLARKVEWRYFEKDGQWYARETNTMPQVMIKLRQVFAISNALFLICSQWAGSSWYYLRFADPKNDLSCIGASAEKDWLPVDLYVGGQEHAVLHLLYARFWHKVLHKLGIVSCPEPFQKVVHQGMILGSDGEKMSKSRGNVVNPDDIVRKHGADALRLYEMFMGPLEAVKPWQSKQVQGVVRFREKVYRIVKDTSSSCVPDETIDSLGEVEHLFRSMHRTVKKVTQDIDALSFNTAISALMIYTNSLLSHHSIRTLPLILVENLVILLSPFAPHCAEEFWEMLGHRDSLSHQPWPSFDESYCVELKTSVVIQINGKKKGILEVNSDLTKDIVVDMAMKEDKIERLLRQKHVVNTIYVPGKIINLIVKPR